MKKKEPIRVAQIIGKWVGGGVEAVVMNYYRHIDHSKIQFDFICDSDSTNIPYEEIESLGGRVILIPPYQKVIKYHKELKKVLTEGKYEIVHSHINTLSVFPLYAAKKARVPVRIAHSHSTTNRKEWKRNILKQVLRPFSKVYATHYMCCSELAGTWLFGSKAYNKGEVYLLNNAIDLDKFKYDEKLRNKKRRELGIKKNQLVIGHIGRFMTQKNHTFLIDIFNEIHNQDNNAILILVGQGPLLESIREKVNQLRLTDYVQFLGQRNDVNELYQAFDVFLLPSLYEGLGVVLIEAQCSGLPCICSTKVPTAAKIIKEYEAIDLKIDKEIWATHVLRIIENSKRKDYKKLIKEADYDIDKVSKSLEKYYLLKVENNDE